MSSVHTWHHFVENESLAEEESIEGCGIFDDVRGDAPKHNHFGEMYCPLTCPACREIAESHSTNIEE